MKLLELNLFLLIMNHSLDQEELLYVNNIIKKVLAGMLYLFSLADQLNLNSFYGQQAVYQVYTLAGFTIALLEMRYITQKLPAYIIPFKYDSLII